MTAIPVRHVEAPVGVEFRTRPQIYEQFVLDTTNMPNTERTSKMILFYDRVNRILFRKNKSPNGEVTMFQYHSISPTFNMNNIRRFPKFEKGMEADAHFRYVRLKNPPCEFCTRPAVILETAPYRNKAVYAKYLMCDLCWGRYITDNRERINDEKIMWMEFDCSTFDKDKSAFTNSPGTMTDYGRELLTDFYLQYNNLLEPCTSAMCHRIAMLPNADPCSFPCRECRTPILHKCCDEFHPPLPCRIFKRWRKVTADKTPEDQLNALLAKDKQCPSCDAKEKASVTDDTVVCEKCRFQYCQTCRKAWNGVDAHDHHGPETKLKRHGLRYVHEFIVASGTYKNFSQIFMDYDGYPTQRMTEHRKAFENKKVQFDDGIVVSQMEKMKQFHKDISNILVFNFYIAPPQATEPEKTEIDDKKPGSSEPVITDPKSVQPFEDETDTIFSLLAAETSGMNQDELKEWLKNFNEAINDLDEKISTLIDNAPEDIRERRSRFNV